MAAADPHPIARFYFEYLLQLLAAAIGPKRWLVCGNEIGDSGLEIPTFDHLGTAARIADGPAE